MKLRKCRKKCDNYLVKDVCPIYEVRQARIRLLDELMIATLLILGWNKIEKMEANHCINFKEK